MRALWTLRCHFRLCLNEGTTTQPRRGERPRCPLCGSLNVTVVHRSEVEAA